MDLGELTITEQTISIGDSQVVNKPVITFCTHYLEQNEAMREYLLEEVTE